MMWNPLQGLMFRIYFLSLTKLGTLKTRLFLKGEPQKLQVIGPRLHLAKSCSKPNALLLSIESFRVRNISTVLYIILPNPGKCAK